jgi:hypothetical protein
MLDMTASHELLNRDVSPCPPEIFAVIWRTVNGHPLSLSLMNAGVRAGKSWKDIELDCEGIGIMDAGRYQTLADRLLRHLRSLLERELSLFEWAERPPAMRGS